MNEIPADDEYGDGDGNCSSDSGAEPEGKRAQHPYATLTPDRVLDALEAAGLHPDGRLLALNSYENRVYQVGMDDGPPLIAKFYRPGRWSDAAIGEEHAFLAELAAAEIPVVPPLPFADGSTLAQHGLFRLALFPRRGGRAPELGDPQTREWMGRFLGRIHAAASTPSGGFRPTSRGRRSTSPASATSRVPG